MKRFSLALHTVFSGLWRAYLLVSLPCTPIPHSHCSNHHCSVVCCSPSWQLVWPHSGHSLHFSKAQQYNITDSWRSTGEGGGGSWSTQQQTSLGWHCSCKSLVMPLIKSGSRHVTRCLSLPVPFSPFHVTHPLPSAVNTAFFTLFYTETLPLPPLRTSLQVSFSHPESPVRALP